LLKNMRFIRPRSRFQVRAEGSLGKMWFRRLRKATLAPVCSPSWRIDTRINDVIRPVAEGY
jgi:hypothetical protein